jgi:hypothetical protein
VKINWLSYWSSRKSGVPYQFFSKENAIKAIGDYNSDSFNKRNKINDIDITVSNLESNTQSGYLLKWYQRTVMYLIVLG